MYRANVFFARRDSPGSRDSERITSTLADNVRSSDCSIKNTLRNSASRRISACKKNRRSLLNPQKKQLKSFAIENHSHAEIRREAEIRRVIFRTDKSFRSRLFFSSLSLRISAPQRVSACKRIDEVYLHPKTLSIWNHSHAEIRREAEFRRVF